MDKVVATIHCETVDEFLAALDQRNPAFASMLPGGWIFRGQSDDSYPLRPNALRRDKPWNDLIFHPTVTNADQAREEKVFLRDFWEVSDSIGLLVPEDTQTLRKLLDIDAPIPAKWPPDEVLSLMALAQHHGIPTRLLDWSRHPLKAALFAATGAAKNPKSTANLVVWALCAEQLKMAGLKPEPFTIVTAPSATNANLRAQEGVFTLANHILPDGAEVDRRPFDDLIREWVARHKVHAPNPWFRRITVPQILADELAFNLALKGISWATLFPDFYGAVAAMKNNIRWQKPGGPAERRTADYLMNVENRGVSFEENVWLEHMRQDRSTRDVHVPTCCVNIPIPCIKCNSGTIPIPVRISAGQLSEIKSASLVRATGPEFIGQSWVCSESQSQLSFQLITPKF